MLVPDVKTPIKMKAFKSRLFVVRSQFPNIYSWNVFCLCQWLCQRWRFVDDVCLFVLLASNAIIALLSSYSWYWIAESGPDVTQLSLALYFFRVNTYYSTKQFLLLLLLLLFSAIVRLTFPYSGICEFLCIYTIWIVSFSTSYINTLGCAVVPKLSFPI